MARPKNTIPKFSIDATGRAFTKVAGKFITLCRGDNPKSRQKHAEILQDLVTSKPVENKSTVKRATVSEVCLRFLTDHCSRYKTSTGDESVEIRCFRGVVKILRTMFGETVADGFGPLRLRAARQAMVERPGDETPWFPDWRGLAEFSETRLMKSRVSASSTKRP